MAHLNNYKIKKNDSETLPILNVLRFLSVDMYINTFQAIQNDSCFIFRTKSERDEGKYLSHISQPNNS